MQRGRNTSLHLWLSLSVQWWTPHEAANTSDAGRLQNLAQQLSHQETLGALGSCGCCVSVLKSPFRNKILAFLFCALQYKSCFWADSHRERLLASWPLQFLSHLWLLMTRHIKSSTGKAHPKPHHFITENQEIHQCHTAALWNCAPLSAALEFLKKRIGDWSDF